jgi:hypothetical protein
VTGSTPTSALPASVPDGAPARNWVHSLLPEEPSPISLYERSLSSGELCQLAVDIAEKEGRSRAHNTRRNSQIICDFFLT